MIFVFYFRAMSSFSWLLGPALEPSRADEILDKLLKWRACACFAFCDIPVGLIYFALAGAFLNLREALPFCIYKT